MSLGDFQPMGSGESDLSTALSGLGGSTALTGAEKAAVIVQMILADGGSLSLEKLPRDSQIQVANDFMRLNSIDRATLGRVVDELEEALNAGSLKFPDSMADTLNTLDGQIDGDLADELRRLNGIETKRDPWPDIVGMPTEELAKIVAGESTNISAILLSKLDPEKASEVIETLSEEDARALMFALSDTNAIHPDLVELMGAVLDRKTAAGAPSAFKAPPHARTAAILNAAGTAMRDGILDALAAEDAEYAALVRKAIFTFADIPTRLSAADIPKVARVIAAEDMVKALAAAKTDFGESVEFLLDNMSKRMADGIREEMGDVPEMSTKAAETAMAKVTAGIRSLLDLGDIVLLPSPDEAD